MVVKVQRHRRAAMRTNQYWVANLNVYLCHQKALQHAPQIGCNFVHFDNKNLRDAVSNLVNIEEVFNSVGIAHNYPYDSGIRRILRIQSKNMHFVVIEKANDLK